MSNSRYRAELAPDQAPKWANLKTIQNATIQLFLAPESVQVAEDRQGSSFLSVRQAAGQLGVHENTIRNWVDRGLLPAVRLPGSQFRRFRRSDVERIRLGIVGAVAAPSSNQPAHELPDGGFSIRNSDDL
jgi:excisionase family DNA binding protein